MVSNMTNMATRTDNVSDELDLADVDQIIERHGRTREAVIGILRAIQEHYRYLPAEALRRIAETTSISPADISGVATFYSQFRHRPAGRHTVKVCIGTACHVKGAEGVFDAFKKHLGIAPDDDTDADRLFTVEKVACLGCCMLAPAVQIDEVTYGPVPSAKVGAVIRDFLQSLEPSAVGRPQGVSVSPVGEVRMCLCSSCVASGAADVYREFEHQIGRRGIGARLKAVGCTGISYQTPLVEVAANGLSARYGKLQKDDVRKVLDRHFRPAGLARSLSASAYSLLDRLARSEPADTITRYNVDVRDGPDGVYFGAQMRIATEHSGELDPLNIDEYISKDGFDALRRVASHQSADDLIEVIVDSGLRGRGGAGFPTGRKWATVRRADADTKYIICNGDEGDPGAFMDRMILESFPFRVIEGMAIAAILAGAAKGYFYVRSEYPLAIRRLRRALEICCERGIIGQSVMGSAKSVELEVVEGAGAFVCGEETALIAAVEGRRGMPRFRPPYPSEEGLNGKPTLVNNVETLALVPWILRHGAGSFASIGTSLSTGTKTFALAGKIVRGGLIEVPMGITLAEIVEEVGGGIQDGHALKAVQVGGPSGGCVPASLADTPVDYEALVSTGAIMGSGGLVVLDETDCMVDVARYFLDFTQAESCGKCTFCRVGTRRMMETLERLCKGAGRDGDIETLERLGARIKAGSLCGLGRTAPNPVLSTIRHFRQEYQAHIEKRCPAGKCRDLITYSITDDCIGCTRCAQRCPAEAIEPRPYQKHEIDAEKCTRCDTCRQVCPADAVTVR